MPDTTRRSDARATPHARAERADLAEAGGMRSTAPSGRFVLRLEPGLHAVLREAARAAGTSLNEYCSRKLAAPSASPIGPAAMLVARAAAMFGDALVGVVAYGSWARGEMTERSDLDVLVIVSSATALTRDLYRQWDEQPLTWDGHQVEPHFAHLPAPEASVSGTWAEMAIDGIVLFERDHEVSRRLAAIRRRLVSGDVTRRSAHGQPYWIRRAEMQNRDLTQDYLHRASIRLRALNVLYQGESWADVVRESQEIVELTLRSLLRASGIEPPRVHDVSPVLFAERSRLPDVLAPHVEELAEISRQLRRDRELAFYGAEDLKPSDFYSRSDAERARAGATRVVELVTPHVGVGL